MERRLSRVLPLTFGTVDAALMLWDIHNQQVIRLAGMDWDTGAPLWPYQTPDTLLFALNAPASLIALPFYGVFHLIVPWHYLALYPAYLFWWWIVGRALGREGWTRRCRGHFWSILEPVAGVVFTVLGIYALRSPVAWWSEYCGEIFTTRNLIMLRLSTPGLWCFAFAAIALVLLARTRKAA